MLVTLFKIGKVHFRFLGTNGYRVKAKNETSVLRRARVDVRISNMNISRRRLADYVKISPKSVPHVQHDYFYPCSQSNHFVCLTLPLPSSFLKLPRVVQYYDIMRFMILCDRHHKVFPNPNPWQNSNGFAMPKERDMFGEITSKCSQQDARKIALSLKVE